jgi:hypothetical protein
MKYVFLSDCVLYVLFLGLHIVTSKIIVFFNVILQCFVMTTFENGLVVFRVLEHSKHHGNVCCTQQFSWFKIPQPV